MSKASRRTSSPLVVTGTTDSFRKNAVNIRSVLTQKITREKKALTRLTQRIKQLEAALRCIVNPRRK